MYYLETYANTTRFNEQYGAIYDFLNKEADQGKNEHFHWGRMEWMMSHIMLEEENLPKIGIFKDETGQIVGIVTFDTELDDHTYLIHSSDDRELLLRMLEYTKRNYYVNDCYAIAVNSKDEALIRIMEEQGFHKTDWKDHVLELSLNPLPEYRMPEGFHMSPENFDFNAWECYVCIFKGFENEGTPEPVEQRFLDPSVHFNKNLKVFALNEQEEYCASCGVWYTGGDTAYIEPVVTIPEYRGLGLGKAVVYEAIRRAGRMGAKRAVVLSTQEFYYKLGFTDSSEFVHWN